MTIQDQIANKIKQRLRAIEDEDIEVILQTKEDLDRLNVLLEKEQLT